MFTKADYVQGYLWRICTCMITPCRTPNQLVLQIYYTIPLYCSLWKPQHEVCVCVCVCARACMGVCVCVHISLSQWVAYCMLKVGVRPLCLHKLEHYILVSNSHNFAYYAHRFHLLVPNLASYMLDLMFVGFWPTANSYI